MTQTGDDIEAKAGRWTFGGDVARILIITLKNLFQDMKRDII